MPSVLVVLYWVWLAGAVAVLCYRVYGRATGRRQQVFSFRDREQAAPAARAEPTAPAPVSAEAMPTPLPLSARSDGPDPEPAPAPEEAAAPVGSLEGGEIHPAVLAAMRGGPAADELAIPDEAPPTPAGGLFSPETRREHRPVSLGTLAPLHETLTGIEMPCDLVPLVELGPRPPREVHRERLVLMTTTTGAGEVAARIADELERLELGITPVSPSSCLARRRDHAVELRIHEFPERVVESAEPAFPTAPEGAVVVEFIAA